MNESAPVWLGLGQVRHTRLQPVRHHFAYPVFFLRVRVNALENDPLPWPLRYNQRGLMSLNSRDYGDGSAAPLLQKIQQRLQQHGIHDVDGAIWLHTFPRLLGYLFNPVSFWFCERANGELRAVVCEVSNTFREKHVYVLAQPDGTSLKNGELLKADKVFYVSPFLPVAGRYQFRFAFQKKFNQAPPLRSVARIDYFNVDDSDSPNTVLQTSISGNFEMATPQRLVKALLRMPFLTLGVMARIHWQALRLWLKRVKFYRHSASL